MCNAKQFSILISRYTLDKATQLSNLRDLISRITLLQEQPSQQLSSPAAGRFPGDAPARQFANNGRHVFTAVRNPNRAPQYSDEEVIEVVTLDVTSAESVTSLVGQLKDRLPNGKLDVLVNNVGFGVMDPLIEAELARRSGFMTLMFWACWR